MKLTADLISRSGQFINALGERELDLRGNKIAVLENLGATKDQFDVIDLSDNEIKKLENFPLLTRLRSIFINNNRVNRIGSGIEKSLPKLTTLVLNNNHLIELADILPLATVTSLRSLSLLDNQLVRLPNYRLFVIHTLPFLKLLDFKKIKTKEREEAKKLFSGKKGKELEQNLSKSTRNIAAEDDFQAAKEKQAQFQQQQASQEDVNRIKDAILRAKNLDEVAYLENLLRAGGKLPSNGQIFGNPNPNHQNQEFDE